MSSYTEKAIISDPPPDEQIQRLTRNVKRLKGIIDQMCRFIKAIGFEACFLKGYYCMSYHHPKLKRCSCGYIPFIGEEPSEPGHWFIMCGNCLNHTASAKSIRDALVAWNSGNLTELSKLTEKPLTQETIDTEGARYVVTKMAQQAASEYKYSVQVNHPDKKLESWFEGIYFSGKPAVEALKEDAMNEKFGEEEYDEEP